MIIDKYLPHFQFRERHGLDMAPPPSVVLQAALNYQPAQDPFFRSMIAIREMPARMMDFIGRQQAEPMTPFSMNTFTLLEIAKEREAVFGLAGRPWRPKYGLAGLAGAGDFEAFDQPGCAKLAFNFAVARLPDGRTRLTTETRVLCLDDEARRKFTPYWRLIRPVSGMIRTRMLAAIRRDAMRA